MLFSVLILGDNGLLFPYIGLDGTPFTVGMSPLFQWSWGPYALFGIEWQHWVIIFKKNLK